MRHARAERRNPLLSLLLVLALAASMIAGTAGTALASHDFPDVPDDHAFHDEISWMADEGITVGFPDGTFRPMATLTRQAVVQFLYVMAGEPQGDYTNNFSDVNPGHAFYDAISWAAHNDYVLGFPDGTFRPTAGVRRQAAASFIFKAVGSPDGAWESSFDDVDEFHAFYTAISWMVDQGITEGWPDNTFRPTNILTRQGAAAFLYRLDQAGWEVLPGDPPAVDPGTPIDVDAGTMTLTPDRDVNPYFAWHEVVADMRDGDIADDQRVRFEVYDRSNAATFQDADAQLRTVAPLLAGQSAMDDSFEYLWDDTFGDYFWGENHVIVVCLVESQGQSCTSDDWVEIDPVDGTLRNIVQDDWGVAEKQWQMPTGNHMTITQEFDANFISEDSHQVTVEVRSQFDGDEYLADGEAGDLLGGWPVKLDVFRFDEDGNFVDSNVSHPGSTGTGITWGSTANNPALPSYGTVNLSYDRDDLAEPVDSDGNRIEFDDVIVACTSLQLLVGGGTQPCAQMDPSVAFGDLTVDDLQVNATPDVPRGNFPTASPGYTFVPRFPTDVIGKEWVIEDLVIVGENFTGDVPSYLEFDDEGRDGDNVAYGGFDEYADAVVVVPGNGTRLSWENELAPYGAVNDLAARFDSRGFVNYAAYHAGTGLGYTEGWAVTVGEIPADGSPAGSNFHIHSGAVDETGGVILGLATPTFDYADGANTGVRANVDFSDFENDGPFWWDLDGKVQDRTAASGLAAMVSATTGWEYDATETDDSVDWYYNVHSVNDSANAITPALVDSVRDNTSGEVRGQLPHGANWIAPNPGEPLGYGHELPPIFQQVDAGDLRYVEPDGTDVTDDVLDGTRPLPDATVTAVQEIDLTFTEPVANILAQFVREIDRDDFTVTVNGDQVDVELATDWESPNETHTIWIDEMVGLNDVVVVTIDEGAAGHIHGWPYTSVSRDLSDSVLTRAIRVGQTETGLGGLGEIAGTVTDSTDGTPIGGASIWVDGDFAGSTDFTGNYSVLVEAGDDYEVQATAPGYEDSDEVEVDVDAYATTTQNFALDREDSGFIGTVTDSLTNAGVGGATVTLREDGAAGDIVGSTSTAADGSFTIGAEAGEYDDLHITIVHPSYTTYTELIGDEEVEIGEYTDLGNFSIVRETGSIAGEVTVDQVGHVTHGDPIAGATVTLSRAGYPNQVTTTDAAGEYSFGDLDPGTWTVTASAGSMYGTDTINVPLAANQIVTDADLELEPDVTIESALFNGATAGTQTFGNQDGDRLRLHFDDNLEGVVGATGYTVTLQSGVDQVVLTCGAGGIVCDTEWNPAAGDDAPTLVITVDDATAATDVENIGNWSVVAYSGILDANGNLVTNDGLPQGITLGTPGV